MADDDFEQYLEDLPEKLQAPVAAAIKEQAEQLSDAQKQALQALMQAPAESGDLEASCEAVPGENDLEYIVQAGGDMTSDEVRGGSGTEFDYGEAFEYGTAHQPARPFFWNTYRARQEGIRQAINDAIERALNE